MGYQKMSKNEGNEKLKFLNRPIWRGTPPIFLIFQFCALKNIDILQNNHPIKFFIIIDFL